VPPPPPLLNRIVYAPPTEAAVWYGAVDVRMRARASERPPKESTRAAAAAAAPTALVHMEACDRPSPARPPDR
jgi:hypothetical protein